MHFALEIHLGTEAMQSNEDLGAALAEVAVRVHQGADHGHIEDRDGLIVGSFDIAQAHPEDQQPPTADQ